MFRKLETEEYPEVKRPTQPRFHGRHQLNRHPDGLEKCVGCELCAWACPADAIFVEGGDNTDEERYSPGERYGKNYQINYLRCIGCGLCIEACPTRSLTMTNEYEIADDDRQRLIYTKDMLLARRRRGGTGGEPVRDAGGRHRGAGGRAAGRGRSGRPGAVVVMSMVVAAAQTGTDPGAELIAFWILAPLAVLGAIGMVFSRNAVHSALWLVLTMLCLGCLYINQNAEFLGFVQIIVYTGAIMMLFLFVLMLTGRDSGDSTFEVLRKQRIVATVLGIGFV